MKKINILLAGVGLLFTFSSCNDFLDKLPDDRAEVDNFEKATQLVSSAYPDGSTDYMMEYCSDNVMDNGKTFNYQTNQDQLFRWKDVNTTGNDDPRYVWGKMYYAIGNANQAIADLSKVKDGDVEAVKAEALLCRAWSMFRLATAFCMAYDDSKADKYLGLPYPKEPNRSIDTRGTLRELYENINADIEAALPHVSESYMTVPKYHFNLKAAYAFAARFNLYYQKWDKAAEYASKALGSQPASLLRTVYRYKTLGGRWAIHDAYINSSENANFMLQTAVSSAGAATFYGGYKRFNSGYDVILNELYWTKMPWGAGSVDNTLYESHLLYGNSQQIAYPRLSNEFEYTDAARSRGYIRTVDAVLTADETLLVRAEAEIHLKKYTEALNDMNLWINAHCAPNVEKNGVVTATRPTLTLQSVNDFLATVPLVPEEITNKSDFGFKKALHPQGFSIDETQTNLLYILLQMRRIETCQLGMRFMDIKRYGIRITHLIDGEDPVYFKSGDLRGALQLPSDVIEAGLEPNPREN
ncbi:RagB/SusD family nutrient uptake outer membrane protein [Prevotella jejuni]